MAVIVKEVLATNDEYTKGPVPSGWVAMVPAVIAAAGMIAMLTVASPSKTDTSGWLMVSTTVLGPDAAMLVTEPMNDADGSAVAVASARLSDATTSADVIVEPSSNLTFWRSCNVSVLLPFEKAQLVARSGTICRFAFSCTSVW